MTKSISVVIPTFNRGEILRRGITSALGACTQSDEVIVVDDRSTDQTPELVASFTDPRVVYSKNENKGLSAARNHGMGLAKNDLIAFMDDDDEWHPEKLIVQKTLLERHPEAVASFTNFSVTDQHGNETSNYLLQWGQAVQDWNRLLGETRKLRCSGFDDEIDYYVGEHYFNQMLDDYVLPSTLLIDRSRFKEQLLFKVGLQRNESWFFSSQVCKQGPVVYVDQDLACQHGDADNRLTSIPIFETVLSRLYVLEHEFGMQTDFTQAQQDALAERRSKEARLLLAAVMRSTTDNRKEIFQANRHHGRSVALAAKLPESVLSLISVGWRAIKGSLDR